MTEPLPSPTHRSRPTARRPRARLRRALGLVLLAATAAGLVLGTSGARAQETEEPAAIGRQAYFTYPLTQITPPLLRNGFPPSTVCLVAGLLGVPQLCGPQVQDLAALLGLSDGLPIPVTPDQDIVQPVLPGTTPVGMLGGQARYVSLLQLAVPRLGEGEQLASYELVLHQDGLNFALESPAFRQVVFAVIGQVSERDPAKLLEDLSGVLEGEVPLLTQTVTGIEACPVLEGWEGGAAQGAGLDGTRLPDVDCFLGTAGSYDPRAQTWTFDLTFAAQAWTSGDDTGETIPNQGIMLRPVGAPNVAYGDPDLSTNWLVSLADGEAAPGKRPVVRYTVRETETAAPPPAAPDPVVPVEPPPSGGGGGLDLGPVPAPPGPAAPAPGQDVSGALRARFAESAASTGPGDLPAWLWLLVPIGLAGAYLFAQSLTAAPAVVRRPGALSRLTAMAAAGSPAATTPPETTR